MANVRNEYREIRNILNRGLFSRTTFALFIEIVLMIFRRVVSKFSYFHLMYYPSDIRRISDTVQASTDYKNTYKIKTIASGPKKLKLANGYLDFETMPNWRQSFDEQEQFFSLHRWNDTDGVNFVTSGIGTANVCNQYESRRLIRPNFVNATPKAVRRITSPSTCKSGVRLGFALDDTPKTNRPHSRKRTIPIL